jgi:solute:Na+ symporter, SSS family
MNFYLFGSLLAGFIGLSLYISKKTSLSIKNSEDYYLSSRQLGVWSLCLTFLATQLGGGAIVGAADAAYEFGWQAVYYALGISCGLFGLSLGIGSKLRQYKISTMPQIFSKLYNDNLLYKLATCIYIISTFLILIAIAVATKKYLISIGFDNKFFFFVFWFSLIIYTSMGGLKAVVQTDILQIGAVLIIFLVTYLYILIYPVQQYTNANININTDSSIPWSSWLLMPLCFTLIGQDMGQRCFSASSPKVVSLSTLLAGILLLITSLLPTYLGVLARNMGLELTGDTSVLMTVISKITNPLITTIFAFAVLMAIISTADSLLCAISSNIAIDVLSHLKNDINVITKARLATIISGILAYTASLYTNDIIVLIIKAYELNIVCFFIPIMAAIFIKTPNKHSARAACIFGASYYLLASTNYFIPKEVICLLGSTLMYGLTYTLLGNTAKPTIT